MSAVDEMSRRAAMRKITVETYIERLGFLIAMDEELMRESPETAPEWRVTKVKVEKDLITRYRAESSMLGEIPHVMLDGAL